MAELKKYVDPNATGSGDGSTQANAYTSLQACETANQAALNGNWMHWLCCASGAKTADVACTINGSTMTTSADYILVDVQADSRHAGSYSTSKYRIETTDAIALTINDDYVRVDGIQIKVTGLTADKGALQVATIAATNNEIRLSNLIICGDSAGSNGLAGINFNDADIISTVYNCLIYDMSSAADSGSFGVRMVGATINVYNCTVSGCNKGIADAGTTASTAKNCISINNVDDFLTVDTIANCASDDGDGTNPQTLRSASNYSAEFTNFASKDFSLVSGSYCVNNGTDNPSGAGYGSTDIIGTTRTTNWDIGAFEYVAAGGAVPPPYPFDKGIFRGIMRGMN